jgi:hypothetical protein
MQLVIYFSSMRVLFGISRNSLEKTAVSRLVVIVLEVTDRCRGNGGLYCSAWRVGGVTVYRDVGSSRRQQQGEGKIH